MECCAQVSVKLSIRKLIASIAIAFVAIVILTVLSRSLGTARPAIERNACKANLKRLYAALQNYIASTGELPRDLNGNLEFDRLINATIDGAERLSQSTLRCPKADVEYLVNPRLRKDDLRSDSSA